MKKQTQRLLSFTVIAVFTVAISNAQFTNLINGGTKMKVTMGRIFILTMLLLITSTIFAQTPDWQWAAKAGGIDDDEGEAITIDDVGNIYVTGSFEGWTQEKAEGKPLQDIFRIQQPLIPIHLSAVDFMIFL